MMDRTERAGSLKIVGISGSLRSKSYNTALLHALGELAPPEFDISVHLINAIPLFNVDDLEAHGLPEPVVALRAVISAADAVIVASPEYNHSMSGAFKNTLDWLSRKPAVLADKPVLILSATNSPVGGARVQYDVRRVIESVYAHVLAMPEVFLGRAPEKFDGDGRLVDPATREALEKQLAAFRDWILRVRLPVHA